MAGEKGITPGSKTEKKLLGQPSKYKGIKRRDAVVPIQYATWNVRRVPETMFQIICGIQ